MILFPKNIKDISRYAILAICLLLVLGSCNTRKFIKDGDYSLKKNTVTLDSDKKIQKKRSLKYELTTLYKQRPASKKALLTKSNLWWYYKTDSIENPNRFQRWIRRSVAQPPSIHQDKIADATATSMKYYLQSKGYYDAEVSYEKEYNDRKKKVIVNYIAKPNNLYTIDSVFFSSSDIKVQRFLNDSEEESFLQKGQPVSEDIYNKEVSRITNTLRNLGFAYFDRNFVSNLSGDSTGTKVNIYLDIINPKNQDEHKIYKVGKVFINPRYLPSEILGPKTDTIIGGFHYLLDNLGPIVSPKSINREIFLKEGELYKEENFIKTNRQLGRLDIYKFISIKTSQDTIEGDKINFEIRLTPKKRMVIGGDLELNNSNYVGDDVNTSLIGVAFNVNYQNRNFRRNASVLGLKVNSGIEFDLNNRKDPIFSVDILTQADWSIPKFVQFPKLYSGLNKIKVLNDNFYRDLKEKAETRVTVSYNRLLLFDFYNYHSFNMSFGYDLQRDNNHRYTWNQTGINYLAPQFEDAFIDIIEENPFIDSSFTKQLFTGFIFKDLKYTHTTKSNIYGNSWKFILDVEQSGLEVLGLNKIYNRLTNSTEEFQLPDTVRFSQYFLINMDTRRYLSWGGKNGVLAYKFAVGIARPFGFSSSVPYVKQFYGGGPKGNRAWRIRELGPGSFVEPPPVIYEAPSDVRQIFYQVGDLKIDINLEYRFNIWGRFNGALFLDAANVWTVNNDPDRPGSQFLLKANPDIPQTGPFYEQFGVGVGFGLRFDFSYFVLGIDTGIKARNPYPNEDGRNWLFYQWDSLRLRDFNPNLLIGYPF